VAFVCNDILCALFFVRDQDNIVSIVTRPRAGQLTDCDLVRGRVKRFMCCPEVLKISCGAYPASCSSGWGFLPCG